MSTDISNTSEFSNLVKTVETALDGDGLNVLINNAGIGGRVSLNGVTEDVMMEFYRINAVAPLLLVQVPIYTLIKDRCTLPRDRVSKVNF